MTQLDRKSSVTGDSQQYPSCPCSSPITAASQRVLGTAPWDERAVKHCASCRKNRGCKHCVLITPIPALHLQAAGTRMLSSGSLLEPSSTDSPPAFRGRNSPKIPCCSRSQALNWQVTPEPSLSPTLPRHRSITGTSRAGWARGGIMALIKYSCCNCKMFCKIFLQPGCPVSQHPSAPEAAGSTNNLQKTIMEVLSMTQQKVRRLFNKVTEPSG